MLSSPGRASQCDGLECAVLCVMKEQCSAVTCDVFRCFRLAATGFYYTDIALFGKLHSSCLKRIIVIYTIGTIKTEFCTGSSRH